MDYLQTLDWVSIAITVGTFLTAGTGLALYISLFKRVVKIKQINTPEWRKAAGFLSAAIWSAVAVIADFVITQDGNGSGFKSLFGPYWAGLLVAAMFIHRIGEVLRTTKAFKSLTKTNEPPANPNYVPPIEPVLQDQQQPQIQDLQL